MRKFCTIFIFIIFLMHFKLCAQVNLVPNGDFEIYSQCPAGFSEINFATPWESANAATPDFYNFCSSTFNPNQAYGPQTTHSGNGIAAIGVFYNYPSSTNLREYTKIKLSDTLVSFKNYYVEFFVSLADKSNYSISSFGCLITDSNYYQNNTLLINAQPQIKNSIINLLNSKNNWVKLSGTYTALGGEQYLILGNFKDDNNSDTAFVGGGTINNAYYFIDDVSVIDSSAIGINEINNNTNIAIYPNPSNGNIQIDLSKLNENGDLQFVVYNTLGVEIKKQQITANEIANVDLSDLANGTYFYKVFKGGKLYKYDKLVLIK